MDWVKSNSCITNFFWTQKRALSQYALYVSSSLHLHIACLPESFLNRQNIKWDLKIQTLRLASSWTSRVCWVLDDHASSSSGAFNLAAHLLQSLKRMASPGISIQSLGVADIQKFNWYNILSLSQDSAPVSQRCCTTNDILGSFWLNFSPVPYCQYRL